MDAAVLRLLIRLMNFCVGYLLEIADFLGGFEEILAYGGEWELLIPEAVVDCD
jgi:hypothetical protein